MNRIERQRFPLSYYHHVPGTESVWCGDCRQHKTMSPRSSRCSECATAVKEMDDANLMPRPFMSGQSHAYTIIHVLSKMRLEFATPLQEGERQLGWFVLPPFQRPPVWTAEQKASFIESIWLELPIGSYTYNSPEEFKHPTNSWLLDGQQRITAILEYVAGEVEAFGYRYTELGRNEQRAFENRSFPAFVTRETDPARLEEIYNRLAYGGTPHQPKEA